MEKKERPFRRGGISGKLLVASLFILSGILLFARNMGWITHELFDIIVSWPSLLIILGIYSFSLRHWISGSIMTLIGAYFLAGGLSWLPENSQAMIWPVALVTAGILFFVKARKREQWMHEHFRQRMQSGHGGKGFGRPGFGGGPRFEGAQNQQCKSVDGFLHSDNNFGAVRHVVLDELFKGGSIRTSFGGTTIDLRHTHLAEGETYLDIECKWGGIELYVPADWKVVTQCDAFVGGCDDKRWEKGNVNQPSTLVIRGNISFGGLEIKD